LNSSFCEHPKLVYPCLISPSQTNYYYLLLFYSILVSDLHSDSHHTDSNRLDPISHNLNHLDNTDPNDLEINNDLEISNDLEINDDSASNASSYDYGNHGNKMADLGERGGGKN
jgi:hypothetical protein